jgi:hypothetical protein
MLMKPQLMKPRIPPRRRDLTPPELPQAVGGVIDVSKITGDIIVQVDKYIGMKHGDRLVGYFGTIRGQPQIVPYEPETLPVSMPLPFSHYLPNGSYEVYYTAEDLLNNLSTSPSVPVTIINSLPGVYPPPVFPYAVDDVITYRSIVGHRGTLIRARYSQIQAGDQVTFHWSGTDVDGNFIPASVYTSPPVTVTATDLSNGYVETLIPQQYILVLGDGGIGTGYYVLKPNAGSGQYTSASASVTISWRDLYTTTVSTTSEAPPVDTADYPYLKPCNRVTVFGQPGLVVSAAVSQGAIINNGLATAQITLDSNGLGRFTVSSQQLGTVAVDVYAPFGAADPQYMTFQSYAVGTAGIYGYRGNTGAPSDGFTPCSVYLRANTGVTSVDASVTGSALINGWTQSGTFPVHKDGTATLNIIDDVAETVTLTLRATGNGNPPNIVQFAFAVFPNFQA